MKRVSEPPARSGRGAAEGAPQDTESARRPPPDRALRLVSIASFFVAWQLIALVQDSRFLPTPLAVATTLVDYMIDGEIWGHLFATLRRVALSFVLAMAIGAALGALMGRRRTLDALLDGWLLVFLNIPALVVTVLCYLWLGLGEVAAVAAVAINKIPTVAVIVREGARAVDPELLQVARAYRLSPRRTFFDVYLPQLYPSLVAAARAGLALIWKIVLVVELLGRSNGVGFQISVFFQFFDIASILAYAFAFIAVVVAIEFALVRPAEQRLTRWRLA